MNDGEKMFWHIRRLIGIRDNDDTPEADAIIRREIETTSQPSVARIRRVLGLPEDKTWF